jgi:hypothetical protein
MLFLPYTVYWGSIIVRGVPMFVGFLGHPYPRIYNPLNILLFLIYMYIYYLYVYILSICIYIIYMYIYYLYVYILSICIYIIYISQSHYLLVTHKIKSPQTSRILVTEEHLPPGIKVIPQYALLNILTVHSVSFRNILIFCVYRLFLVGCKNHVLDLVFYVTGSREYGHQ